MKPETQYVCPRCEYPLIPVHAVEGRKRRVIALSCPEPYCDHMQLIPRDRANKVLQQFGQAGPSVKRAIH